MAATSNKGTAKLDVTMINLIAKDITVLGLVQGKMINKRKKTTA
jgi:hypothetical protein